MTKGMTMKQIGCTLLLGGIYLSPPRLNSMTE